MNLNPVEPIFTAELFSPLHKELLDLLRGLNQDDWHRPTAAKAWTVKDIAAHLLDTDIRRLSLQRDHLPMRPPESPIESYRDLVDFLNQLNADWVKAAKRISPRLLIDFLSVTGDQVAQHFLDLDPFATAIFPVAWAGDESSLNWFDIAREYTEKWHHQQQIRDAVGAEGLTGRRWLFPVIDTFLRGLPHTYRDLKSDDETKIVFIVTGESGGGWTLLRGAARWKLFSGRGVEPDCTVKLDQDTAWRLMTKGLTRDEGSARVEIAGNKELGYPLLGMLAVMA